MAIRALLFDYGGVLIHMVNETPRRQLAERLGVSLLELYRAVFDSPAATQAVLGQITAAELWESVADDLGVPRSQVSGLYWQFWAADGLNLDVIEYIRTLRRKRKAGYTIGLLSNANDDLRAMLTERWQIAGLFDEMVISAEVKDAKPNPSIYRLALERLGVEPAEAVFLDDVAQNVESAQAAGLFAVQYKTWRQARRDLGRVLRDAGSR